ncbi:MAG: hypothetical protein IT222_00660 [Crocinitomix sp.]|nr:hypothetical protein [Crocinitomix sp.]
MKYLPSENITYKSKLKEDEIIKRLSETVEPEKLIRFSFFSKSASKYYEGYVDGQTFSMRRIISYRNSFIPKITGLIEPDFDGTTIRVKMRLHIFVIVFLCIWCGGVGLAFITTLAYSFSNFEFNPATIFLFIMLLFLYTLTMVGFKYESKKSKKHLQDVFQAEIIDA